MKRVLILSGPTREHIDPVRYLSNASSGKMGKAIAEEAVARGFVVDFISVQFRQKICQKTRRFLFIRL